MERAAVFTSEPQAVEVYQAGTWWSGELLGWRHDSSGSCQVWVRVVLAGVEETAWTDLSSLRLPERPLTPASEVAGGALTRKVARGAEYLRGVDSPRRHARTDDLTTTSSLPVVRDLAPAASATPAAPRPGGRRRAPEDADVQTMSSAAVPVPVGRHRAPATGVMPVVPGRHRVADTGVMPVVPGRHRVADTGLFPVVSDENSAAEKPSRRSAADTWSVPAARSPRREEGLGRARDGWGLPSEPPELLTRPMRLSDHVPHARRPRLDGSLSSA
jgi:hypothetical protein